MSLSTGFIQGRQGRIAVVERSGRGTPIVCLHGLGSTAEDWRPVLDYDTARSRHFVCVNFPGSGDSPYPPDRSLSVHDLAEVVAELAKELSLSQFHLVGHSLGGLVGVLAAVRLAPRISSLVTIEGNLAPEDCSVFSRSAAGLTRRVFEDRFLQWLHLELERSPTNGDAVFAAQFRSNVTQRAFYDYCRSIVQVCDTRPLLQTFLQLGIPRMHMRGELSVAPSYLPQLSEADVETVVVPNSGHFPLYANPSHVATMYLAFLERVEIVSRERC